MTAPTSFCDGFASADPSPENAFSLTGSKLGFTRRCTTLCSVVRGRALDPWAAGKLLSGQPQGRCLKRGPDQNGDPLQQADEPLRKLSSSHSCNVMPRGRAGRCVLGVCCISIGHVVLNIGIVSQDKVWMHLGDTLSYPIPI